MTITPAIKADTVPVAPRRLSLRIVLFALALSEAFDGLSHVSTLFGIRGPFGIPTLFGEPSQMPGPGFGGFLVKAHIATHPPLALAALLLAARGKVRGAIVALGAILVIRWLNYVPEVVQHGLDFASPEAVVTLLAFILSPLAAACAISCALHNERLGIATFLLGVPVLFNLLLVIVALTEPEPGY